MGKKEEVAAIIKLFMKIGDVATKLEKIDHGGLAIKLRITVADFQEMRERYLERNAILSNLESAALVYGSSITAQSVLVCQKTLMECAVDLAKYDAKVYR